MVSIAHRNADRLVLLINDILDVEKIAAGRMQFSIKPSDVSAMLQDAIEESQPYAEKFGIRKAIAERHDGRLSFESKINKGTTFSFILPFTKEIVSGFTNIVVN